MSQVTASLARAKPVLLFTQGNLFQERLASPKCQSMTELTQCNFPDVYTTLGTIRSTSCGYLGYFLSIIFSRIEVYAQIVPHVVVEARGTY